MSGKAPLEMCEIKLGDKFIIRMNENEGFILEILFIYKYKTLTKKTASFCLSQQTTKMEEKAKVKQGLRENII